MSGEPQGHDTYHHADGTICVVLDDEYFIPYDIGGEGTTCTKDHGPKDQRSQ